MTLETHPASNEIFQGQNSQASLPLPALIESILFIADGEVSIDALARSTGATRTVVASAIDALVAMYHGRGLRLQLHEGAVQLVTAPEAAPFIELFLAAPRPNRLSAAALETLSIVAYRGPITRAAIEALRGIESNAVVSTLLARGLIEECGHAETLGRPALLAVTHDFLRHFGLENIDQLPRVLSQ